MICDRCRENIPEGEEYQHLGKNLCEDCYVEVIEPPRTCDVTAVYSAKLARRQAGQVGTDGLLEIQKDIYNFIKTEGPVTHEQIARKFSLAKWELENHFATLRHCELVRAFRESGKVMVTIWQEGGPGELKLDDGEEKMDD